MFRNDFEYDGMITDRHEEIRSAWRRGTVARTMPRQTGRVRRTLGKWVVSLGTALIG